MSTHTLHNRNPAEIGRMFSAIARRYDLMNGLMTAGMDRMWRQELVDRCRLRAGDRVLDLGTGTGELALSLQSHANSVEVWAADISLEMLVCAQAKPKSGAIRFHQSDAQRLPLPDASFDVVVSAFLLRNLPDHALALREQTRVLKPGGRLLFLDILAPEHSSFGVLYRLFFCHAVPVLGKLVSGSDEAYRYLPQSTSTYPSAFRLMEAMRHQGLEDCAFSTLMGNAIVIHEARKPADFHSGSLS